MSSTTAPEPSHWSLAAQLTFWYAVSSFLLVLGATGFLYWALHANLDREDDQHLANKVQTLQQLLRDRQAGRPGGDDALRREVEAAPGAAPYARFLVRILDSEGGTLLASPGMAEELPADAFPPPADDPTGSGREAPSASGRSCRLVAVQADGGLVVQVAFDQGDEEALLAGYRRNLYAVLAASLVICAVVSYLIARHGLRPLTRISAAAAGVRAATLHHRLGTDGLPAELFGLATTFNDMLGRLEDSFARLSRFSADIAHELRTPVNNLRGEAEVALGRARTPEEYREVLGSCLEECGRLARLIDSLLFLARAENPRTQIDRESVDVGRELEAVRDFHDAAATESGVRLTVHAPADLVVSADRMLLQRAVANLVANALAHTPAGGHVRLTGRADGTAVTVEVADTGPGIASEHLPHVFDRFYRADAARGGGATGRVGLGLAIVKSIAVLHGGTASIASGAGAGTRVTLTFPQTSRG